ncbi:MAG: hypothetical protein WC460_03425 [Patescibacteria group bacterium]
MLDTRKLNDEELRKLMSKPLSEKDATRIRKLRKKARWLLAISLSEMPDLKTVEEDSPTN